MQTESDVVASELERVLPRMPTLYEYDDYFFSSIEKSDVEVISKRDMRIPLKIRPGGDFGYTSLANADLGTGTAQVLDKGVISTVTMKMGVQWDLESAYATDDRRKAIVSSVQENLADIMKEFRRATEAQCMTDGTGVLATVTSVTTANGVDTVLCTTDGYGVKLLRYGQKISVYDTTRATNRTANGPVAISYWDIPSCTFKIPSVAGIIAGDVILPEGLTGATPVGLYGYKYHASASSSGSWLGLTRSSYPEIIANRVNANGAGLALPHGRLALNKIGDRLGLNANFKPVAWMHPCQVQAYEELGQLVSIIQKQPKDDSLDLYFSDNMQIAGAPIRKSYMWDKKRIDFIIPQMWGRAEMHPIKFHESGGRRIFEMRGPSGGVATSEITYILASWNLFCKNPASCSFIDNLAVPEGYIPS